MSCPMKITCVVFATAILAACGGGGGTAPQCASGAQACAPDASTVLNVTTTTTTITTTTTTTTLTTYTEPSLPTSASVAQQCATPRPVGTIDPTTQRPYGDIQGSLTKEKLWIRSFVNETYLWYKEVVPIDPATFVLGASASYTEPSTNNRTTVTLNTNFDVVDTYFNSQRSLLLTSSGKPKDQFHFTYKTTEWVALSTSGSSVGFGFKVALLARSPPRSGVVAYSEPGSTAATNSVNRGTKFISVNGVDLANGTDIATLNEGLFSPISGKQYTFGLLDQGSTVVRSVTMTAGTVTSTPVQNVHTLPAPYNSVGYIQFNEHIATAESQLIAAVNQLKAANSGAGIGDLVLDLRYNGGGLLDIASELAYMIAGSTVTSGKIFEKNSFNDKNPYKLTDADAITSFHNVTQGFSTTFGQALPQLRLSRVFVIVGQGTCSASEAVINGLNGIGINVILIGATTCGKPYGFFPQDNCGVTYFTIQLKGVNNVGFGDYADGFSPGGNGSPANNLRGCVVADDFSKQLGDPAEARLAAALQYRTNGTCTAASLGTARSAADLAAEPVLGRPFALENRFYRPKIGR